MESEAIASTVKGAIQGIVDPVTKSVNSHLDRKFENIESEKERNLMKQRKNMKINIKN